MENVGHLQSQARLISRSLKAQATLRFSRVSHDMPTPALYLKQMAGRGWDMDRAREDFCFSAFLTLAKAPSPGLGAQCSWTPAGEGKTEALTEQFDKY